MNMLGIVKQIARTKAQDHIRANKGKIIGLSLSRHNYDKRRQAARDNIKVSQRLQDFENDLFQSRQILAMKNKDYTNLFSQPLNQSIDADASPANLDDMAKAKLNREALFVASQSLVSVASDSEMNISDGKPARKSSASSQIISLSSKRGRDQECQINS